MNTLDIMKKFVTPEGTFDIPPYLTLAAMCELSYMKVDAAGEADTHNLRFWDYSSSQEGEVRDYTRREVNTRIKVVAARLQQVSAPGKRVAILAGNSPEYIFGFLGAQYAGMVPIPLYDPTEPGHGAHLEAVLADSTPDVVLTNKDSAKAVRSHFAALPAAERPRIVAVDALPDTLAESWVNPSSTPEGQAAMAQGAPLDQTSFLQYTSGSTRTPAGVVLSNRSIVSNVLQVFTSIEIADDLRVVSWLPLHHDMGIILAVFAMVTGLPIEIMRPRDFVQRPSRWIDQIADRESSNAQVYSVVPNFALELSARYGQPKEGQSFNNVHTVIVGSEPVSQSAVESFLDVFTPRGFKREVILPSYGLAEAALAVSIPFKSERPSFSHLDREELAKGKAVAVEKGSENAVTFASVGQALNGLYITVVDPESNKELSDAAVGEVWVQGGNNATGYLDRPEETQATFANTLAERLAEGSRVEGAEDTNWLATGDLGVYLDGELYITGRLKDLVVVAGRNHYPQDIEATVQEASDHVRKDSVAAFAVPGDAVEKLIIIAERDERADASGDAEAIDAIRAAVASVHGVTPSDIQIAAPMQIKRSSSGKIARRVNQKHYLEEASK